jgi:C1q domain
MPMILGGSGTINSSTVNVQSSVLNFTAMPFLNRVDTSTEGGEIKFARSSDNLGHYSIDVYGSGSTPGLRVVDNVAGAVRLNIDSSGRVTKPYQPVFRAYNTSSSGNLTTATWTKVNLNAVDYDVGSNFNTSTGRFTAPIAGYYLMIGHILYSQNNDNVTYGIQFYKNANGDGSSRFRFYTSGAADTRGIHEINTSMIYNLSAGDYMELYGFCEGTADQTFNSNCVLQGYLL